MSRIYACIRPKWKATSKCLLAIEDAVSHLRTPKEWPRPNHAFSNGGSLKTSELLLLAGNNLPRKPSTLNVLY